MLQLSAYINEKGCDQWTKYLAGILPNTLRLHCEIAGVFPVKMLVLPATDNAKPMWTNKFGFKEIPEVQLEDYKQTCWQMITFDRTSLLQKPVPNCRIINQEQADSDVPLQ
ncbi:UNVERIFIED_CONTAM: hypothetical protein Sindi_1820100 [Sesamum indicum]